MSTTILEEMRQAHEDIEAYERATVKELCSRRKAHQNIVLQDHFINGHLHSVAERVAFLSTAYTDEDALRRAELDELTGVNVFNIFYDRLRDVREHYRVHPEQDLLTKSSAQEEAARLESIEEPVVHFSGEEFSGRFLDLHLLYNHFVNLNGIEFIEYSQFVDEFSALDRIPRSRKDNAYGGYVQELLDYLVSFVERAQPLQDPHKVLREADEEFEREWPQGKVPGWDMETDPRYCKYCDKAFANDAVFAAHTTGKRHKKAEKEFHADPTRFDAQKKLAQLEFRVGKMADLLSDVITATRNHITKKQTMTMEELQAELEEEEVEEEVEESESDDEEKPIYNPLNIPLGWDGKPIPYWLYKLHGLNIEYKCEICGNETYKGPRNFDRHFRDWRHAHGMRCLKIPNTYHFHNITLIEDAKALWIKIQKDSKAMRFKPETEEEFEDREGNVFSKKTFEDLKRQGLLG